MKTCPKCQQSNLPDNIQHCFSCGYDFSSSKVKKSTSSKPIFATIFAVGVGIIILILMVTGNRVDAGPSPVSMNTPKIITVVVTATSRPSTETEKKVSTPTARTILPSKTPTAYEEQDKSYVTISCAEDISQAALRKSPGYASKDDAVDIIYKVDCGQQLLLLGDSQHADGLRWWKVSWNGYVGWMADHTGSGRTILVFD